MRPDGGIGRMLDVPRALPPKEQRIIAPSSIGVRDSNMGSEACVCAVMITDPINLTIMYVPCTPKMVMDLRDELARHDPRDTDEHNAEDNAA